MWYHTCWCSESYRARLFQGHRLAWRGRSRLVLLPIHARRSIHHRRAILVDRLNPLAEYRQGNRRDRAADSDYQPHRRRRYLFSPPRAVVARRWALAGCGEVVIDVEVEAGLTAPVVVLSRLDVFSAHCDLVHPYSNHTQPHPATYARKHIMLCTQHHNCHQRVRDRGCKGEGEDVSELRTD